MTTQLATNGTSFGVDSFKELLTNNEQTLTYDGPNYSIKICFKNSLHEIPLLISVLGGIYAFFKDIIVTSPQQ